MLPLAVLLTVAAAGSDPAPVVRPALPAVHALVRVHPGPWRPSATTLAGTAGMRVAVDPETGQLVPAAPGLGTSAFEDGLEAVVTETMPDGSLRVVLGEAGQSYSIVRLDAGGRAHRDCVHEAAAAHTRLAEPVSVRDSVGEER